MHTLIVATRNKHKIGEIRGILGSGFSIKDLGSFLAPPRTVEDAPTFRGNAIKKATELARWLGHQGLRSLKHDAWVLADDSGLEVDCLNGQPGVHSARFAALDSGASGNSTDADNNAKLLRLLAGVVLEKRTARFRCVLALTPVRGVGPEPASPVCYQDEADFGTLVFEGVCEGMIQLKPTGQGGFGYDPLFVPVGFDQSFAELGPDTKNLLSHRAKALFNLKQSFPAATLC
jgi:XTP/dITP diphosphohydrolase